GSFRRAEPPDTESQRCAAAAHYEDERDAGGPRTELESTRVAVPGFHRRGARGESEGCRGRAGRSPDNANAIAPLLRHADAHGGSARADRDSGLPPVGERSGSRIAYHPGQIGRRRGDSVEYDAIALDVGAGLELQDDLVTPDRRNELPGTRGDDESESEEEKHSSG